MPKNQILFHPGALEEKNGKWLQMGFKCDACGKTSYPVVELCPFCSSGKGKKKQLSKTGTVFSYTITRVPVGPYKPPVIAGYIDLPEGTRVFGQIRADIEDLKTGLQVEMKTGVIWTEKDGTEVLGYYYVPCKNGCGGAN